MTKQTLRNKYIYDKANNQNSIRVLYKKSGQPPEVRIINNVQNLKKAIIIQNLNIIPYEDLFIICKYAKPVLNTSINVFLPLTGICGNLIVVRIDKNKREFKGLSQEDIIWYSQDLINKSSFNNIQN